MSSSTLPGGGTVERITSAATTAVVASEVYDQGRFAGSEYNRAQFRGQPIICGAESFQVGEKSGDRRHKSTARLKDPGAAGRSVAVGRMLPNVVNLLASPTTRLVETADGLIELYGGAALLAVYDPAGRMAGDLVGTPNASADQLAAVLAHRLLHPANEYDRDCLADLGALAADGGTGLAAADGAYLALINGPFAGGGTVRLGGTIATDACPACGEPMGDAHRCAVAASAPVPGVAADASAVPVDPRPVRAAPARRGVPDVTAQEHILRDVRRPRPDPSLSALPPEVGGQRATPLAEYIPQVDPAYTISANTERVWRCLSAQLQAWRRVAHLGPSVRAACDRFGLYGPPGSGKNTLARQLAASLITVAPDGSERRGMNYVQVDIEPDSTIADMIGAVVLEPDGLGGTRSAVRLGKIGLAAAMGSVICVNEIARNARFATVLQSILEDGEIILASPEAGMVNLPVHPATIIFLTWNPGAEGDPDRPAAAPLSRITAFRFDLADAAEREHRALGFLTQFAPGGDRWQEDFLRRQERERQLILGRDYAIPLDIVPTAQEVARATRLLQAVELLASADIGARQIGLNSATPAVPGDRQLVRYLLLGTATRDWSLALEPLAIYCDQGAEFPHQWRLIEERHRAIYGTPPAAQGGV